MRSVGRAALPGAEPLVLSHVMRPLPTIPSVERETLRGTYGAHPFGTAEAIDIHAALRSYTAWAARQLFLEDRIGSLEVGKDADIAVWDRDLYAMPARELKTLRCELTIMHGEVVYDAHHP